MSRPAVFLDRDGVLVEEIFYSQTGEWEAPLRPEDVRLIPGAAAAARRLAEAGYALVLISNQAAFVGVDRPEPLLQKTPIDRLPQLHQRVFHVDDLVKP